MIVFTHQRESHKHSFGSDVSLKSWVPPSKSSGFFLVDWLLFPAKAHKNPDTNLLNMRGVKSPLREGEVNWKRKKNHKSRPLSSLNWRALLWPWFVVVLFSWNVFPNTSWVEKSTGITKHWGFLPFVQSSGCVLFVQSKGWWKNLPGRSSRRKWVRGTPTLSRD